VAFEVEAPFGPMGHCHCSMCRKHHGTAFQTWLGATAKGFRFVQGAGTAKSYASSPGGARWFCPRCGSALPNPPAGDRVFVPAGLLDGDPGVRPEIHLFAGSKAVWYDIPDALPRADEYPDGWGEAVPYARPTEPAPGRVRGSCLCGGVAYEFPTSAAGPIIACHCTRCRRARAAAHGTNLFVDAADFHWLRGEDLLASYKVPEAERYTQTFCTRCGSSVPRLGPGSPRAVIPAGTLDDDPGTRLERHIFTGSKAPWFEIADRLPQHAEYPPGGPPILAARAR
jgi:hypothetical protein